MPDNLYSLKSIYKPLSTLLSYTSILCTIYHPSRAMGKSSPVRPGQDPASIKAKRLQSTFESHLEIELTLLRALIDRSKFQHRGQPFLQRMREVYRLGQRVRKIQTSEKVDEENLKLLAPKVRHASHVQFAVTDNVG